MRLDKAITDAGWGSRTFSKDCITEGRVTIDGVVCTQVATDVNPMSQQIILDGQAIDYQPFYWIMMHKPQGVVSATTDARDTTVVHLLSDRYKRMDMFPVGRLDKTSTGLIILTNDGVTGHKLLAPKSHVSKVYRVMVEGCLTAAAVTAFAQGMTLADGQVVQGAALDIESAAAYSVARVTLQEGKYHQIKRMFGVLGFPVETLHRLSMGSLTLDDALPPGGWRRLTSAEIQLLQN